MRPFLIKFGRHVQLYKLHNISNYFLPAAIPFKKVGSWHLSWMSFCFWTGCSPFPPVVNQAMSFHSNSRRWLMTFTNHIWKTQSSRMSTVAGARQTTKMECSFYSLFSEIALGGAGKFDVDARFRLRLGGVYSRVIYLFITFSIQSRCLNKLPGSFTAFSPEKVLWSFNFVMYLSNLRVQAFKIIFFLWNVLEMWKCVWITKKIVSWSTEMALYGFTSPNLLEKQIFPANCSQSYVDLDGTVGVDCVSSMNVNDTPTDMTTATTSSYTSSDSCGSYSTGHSPRIPVSCKVYFQG